ncbi:MAG: AraC family transcriptional regulator [Myxococcota bacterium]|nr:AraC family transcriptional regulator [Myxococcota bacterium]
MRIHTISISYVIRLLELAERDGASAAALLARAGMAHPRLERGLQDLVIDDDLSDVRVPTEHYYRLWGVTMATLRDPTFPLRLADRMDTASFDALGYAVITSATLGDAFGRIQRYLRFVTDGASWVFEHAGDAAVVTFTQHGAATPEHQYVDEFSLAHLVLVGRKLTAAPWEVEEVRFRHPAPADIAALQAFFRAPIQFGATATQLRLPRAVLGLRFAKGDPNMAAFFDRHIEAVLQRTQPEDDFVTGVRRLIATALVRNEYALEDLAPLLAMSPRTLRRRLAAEGVTYSALLEDVRRDLAERYLRERRLSLGEIAFALGYSEPATFHRAFRRWKNVTPAAYRSAHRPARPDEP